MNSQTIIYWTRKQKVCDCIFLVQGAEGTVLRRVELVVHTLVGQKMKIDIGESQLSECSLHKERATGTEIKGQLVCCRG